jgi:hypothetical protein
MTQHVVIRVEEYVAGSTEKPEVQVFTQSHASRPPLPWGKIAVGDTVWMKWSGGPIVAKGLVQGFRQIENCTSNILRNSVGGTKLYDLEAYWQTRPPVFFGMAIFVGYEEWIIPPIFPNARSFGDSWIILDSSEKQIAWLTDRGEKSTISTRTSKSRKASRTLRASVRFEVLRRDNFTCRYCGRKAPSVRLQVDHVVPWSAGGSDELSNLVAACIECNIGKSAKSVTGILAT